MFAIGELKLSYTQLYEISPFEYELRALGYIRSKERDSQVVRFFATMFRNANREKNAAEMSPDSLYPFSIDNIEKEEKKEWDTLAHKDHIKAITRHLPNMTNEYKD